MPCLSSNQGLTLSTRLAKHMTMSMSRMSRSLASSKAVAMVWIVLDPLSQSQKHQQQGISTETSMHAKFQLNNTKTQQTPSTKTTVISQDPYSRTKEPHLPSDVNHTATTCSPKPTTISKTTKDLPTIRHTLALHSKTSQSIRTTIAIIQLLPTNITTTTMTIMTQLSNSNTVTSPLTTLSQTSMTKPIILSHTPTPKLITTP